MNGFRENLLDTRRPTQNERRKMVVGAIRCSCLKWSPTQKMAPRTVKSTKFGDMVEIVKHIWGIFDLVRLR